MVKRICTYAAAVILVFSGRVLGAQPTASVFLPGWELYHTEGEIIITQEGVRTRYPSGVSTQERIVLMPNDMIQTGKGAAEIQLVSGTGAPDKTYTIIKMGENTSILIDKPENNKESALELFYGRIRVATGTAEPAIVFRAGNSLTTLQNCDTVIDYTSRLGLTQPILTLHCFYGQGEVIPRFAPGTETSKFAIRGNESFSMEYRVPYSYVQRKNLDPSVLAYCHSDPFTSGAPLPIPEAVLTAQGAVDIAATPENPPDTDGDLAEETGVPQTPPKASRHRINVAGLVTGLLVAAGGAALQVYSTYGDPNPKFQKPLFYGGFGPEALGALLIIGSLTNPKDQVPLDD